MAFDIVHSVFEGGDTIGRRSAVVVHHLDRRHGGGVEVK